MTNVCDCKIVLFGNEGCGKTCLFHRYIHESYIGSSSHATIGAAYSRKDFINGERGEVFVLGLWDTAGSERYATMAPLYYRNAFGAILCYDVNNLESWNKIQFWNSEISKHTPETKKYICACKMDLISEQGYSIVDEEMVKKYAEEISASYFQTSSKNGLNVNEMFDVILKDYIKEGKAFESTEPFPKMTTKPLSRKSSCC